MIRPRYITMIRSASAVTSSSSVETTMTGMPASRVSTMRLWMNSIEPTSTPRVGCAATRSDELAAQLAREHDFLLVAAGQRADRALDAPGARTSNSRELLVGELGDVAEPQIVPPRTKGAPFVRSRMRFSAIVNAPTSPSSCAVLGHEADALVEDAAARSRRRAPRRSSLTEPRTRCCEADQRLGELGLAVSLHAGDRERSRRARTSKLTSLTTIWSLRVDHGEVLRPRARGRRASARPCAR